MIGINVAITFAAGQAILAAFIYVFANMAFPNAALIAEGYIQNVAGFPGCVIFKDFFAGLTAGIEMPGAPMGLYLKAVLAASLNWAVIGFFVGFGIDMGGWRKKSR